MSQVSSIACQSSQIIMSTSGIMASSTPILLTCSYLSYEVGVVVVLASMWMTSSSCMGMASSSSTMYIFLVGGIIISKLGASLSMEPSISWDNTLEVEGKSLEIKVVSHDLSTTTLNSLGVSLMPSKWNHSISRMVESLISLLLSLKWAKWFSYSHGIGTVSSLKDIGIGSM